ncbi:hypothetical protein PM082_006896 [Marasmius tenuissimus]|nr:hypothetical protein PM082_006896 [Marasmius tenuissimus]
MSEGRRSLGNPTNSGLKRVRKERETPGQTNAPKRQLVPVVEISQSKKRKTTKTQSTPSAEERMATIERELERVKETLEEKTTQLAKKSKQLAAIDAIYSTSDVWSVSDVIREAKDITARVYQISAQLTNIIAETTSDKRNSNIQESRTAREIHRFPGLDSVLKGLKGKRSSNERSSQMVLQSLLQYCIIQVGLMDEAKVWHHSPQIQKFCANLFDVVRSQEQPIVGRFWRAVTKKAMDAAPEQEKAATDRFARLRRVVAEVLAEALPGNTKTMMISAVKRKFDDDLWALFEVMQTFHEHLTQDIKSRELELFFPLPGAIFDDETMGDEEPEEGMDREVLADQKVFLSVGIGIIDKAQEGSHGTVLLKARVYKELVKEVSEEDGLSDLSELDSDDDS